MILFFSACAFPTKTAPSHSVSFPPLLPAPPMQELTMWEVDHSTPYPLLQSVKPQRCWFFCIAATVCCIPKYQLNKVCSNVGCDYTGRLISLQRLWLLCCLPPPLLHPTQEAGQSITLCIPWCIQPIFITTCFLGIFLEWLHGWNKLICCEVIKI